MFNLFGTYNPKRLLQGGEGGGSILFGSIDIDFTNVHI